MGVSSIEMEKGIGVLNSFSFKDMVDSFGSSIEDYKKKVSELLNKEELNISNEEMEELINTIIFISNYRENFNNREYLGNQLRESQKLSIIGFQNFLINSIKISDKTGYIILPTGQGKSAIINILSSLVNGKSICLSLNNSDKNQIQSECSEYLKEQGIGKNVGEISKDKICDEDILFGLFENFFNRVKEGTLNISQYKYIFIDEVDINGLSKKRQLKLYEWSKIYNIYIIGLSATHIQASGKRVEEFYNYDILNLPMPESLPELYEKNLMPDTSFEDIVIDKDLYVSGESIDAGIYDEDIDSFVMDTKWIDSILKYHIENNNGKMFLLAFRNNKLNEIVTKRAEQFGLNIYAFYGDLSLEERIDLIERYKNGEIDGFVGSKLIGRGLNLVNCEVVYNSLLTYSPQLFWQLGGRCMRTFIDNEGNEKKSKFITFLPSEIYDEKEKKQGLPKFPLCFSAFTDKNYFSSTTSVFKSKKINIKDVTKEQISSIEDIMLKIDIVRQYGEFEGKVSFLTDTIKYMDNISVSLLINFLSKINNIDMKTYIEQRKEYVEKNGIDESDKFSEEEKYYIDYYYKISDSFGELSIVKEKELREKIFNSKDKNTIKNATEELLKYHLKLIVEIAKKYRNETINVEDLINIGIEAFYKAIENFDNLKKARFCIYLTYYLIGNMDRYVSNVSRELRIPSNKCEYIKKVEKLLNERNDLSERNTTEISEILEIPESHIEQILSLMQEEFIPYEDIYTTYDNPYYYAEQKSLEKNIGKILSNLTPRQEEILRMNFGINYNHGEKLYLKEIGKIYDVTTLRITSIRDKALRILRHPSKIDFLMKSDGREIE